MDGAHFDALAKHMSSRRTALGGLLAGVFLTVDAAARGKNTRRNRQAKNRRKGKDKGKGQSQRRDRDRAGAQATQCWRAGACIPKKGANVSQCDLAGYTAAPGLDCTGCNLSRANLRGATFSGANFTRANLSGACLIDADFTGATFANNTNLANAIFCRTKMPNGSLNNSRCGAGTACCASCLAATCQSLGKTCGAWPDGCGGTLSCGSCAAGSLCDDGACQTCDVTCTGTPAQCGASLQVALDAPGADATVYVCPGTYRGGFTLSTVVTVVGAGQGDNPGVDTILDGNIAARVVSVLEGAGNISMRRLRITNGREIISNGGAGIYHLGTLLDVRDCTVINNHTVSTSLSVVRGAISSGTLSELKMNGCTVRDNSATAASDNGRAWGAGIFASGDLEMTDCVIRNNVAISDGSDAAGIYKSGGIAQLTRCRITENTLTQPADGSAGGVKSSSATVTLNDSYVWGNTSPDCGGVIVGSGCGTAPPA